MEINIATQAIRQRLKRGTNKKVLYKGDYYDIVYLNFNKKSLFFFFKKIVLFNIYIINH